MEISKTLAIVDELLNSNNEYRVQFDLLFSEYGPITFDNNKTPIRLNKYNSLTIKQRTFYKPYSKILNLKLLENNE